LLKIDRNKINIQSDVRVFLDKLIVNIGETTFNRDQWLQTISTWKMKYPSVTPSNPGQLNPNEFIFELSDCLTDNAIICSDVGLNQMWVAQSIKLNGKRSLLNSGGHGAMGYSLPAAIGAFSYTSDRQIISIMGDGGVQMNSQELHTIIKEKIPAKVVILNNHSLGMIRSYQEKALSGKTYGSVEGFSSPDFFKIAFAYGFKYHKISTLSDLKECATDFKKLDPCIFEVLLEQTLEINPGPAYNRPVEDQYPLIDRTDYQQIIDIE